jgi:hypothetical protein
MDWFSAWEPVPYIDIERVEPPVDAAGRFAAWLVVTAIVLAAMVMWYRQRVVRRSFWCATVEREIEVRRRLGCVLSCSAFENPTAIVCSRRCADRAFRVQWPPALPVVTSPRGAPPVAR